MVATMTRAVANSVGLRKHALGRGCMRALPGCPRTHADMSWSCLFSKPRHYAEEGPAICAITTSDNGGDRSGSTSNDAGDPSPIVGLFANAAAAPDAAAAPAAAALRSHLWTAPSPRWAPLPSTRHRGLTDGDRSLFTTSLSHCLQPLTSLKGDARPARWRW